MNHSRGKFLGKAFRLAAIGADRRFASRRRSTNGSCAWRPIILRWSRRRQSGVNVLQCRSVHRSVVSHYHQVHFHFVTNVGAHSQVKYLPGVAPARVVRQASTPMAHQQKYLATLVLPPRQSRGDSRSPVRGIISGARSAMTWRDGVMSIPGTAKANSAEPILAEPGARSQDERPDQLPEIHLAMTSKVQKRFSRTNSQIWQHRHQAFYIRKTGSRSSVTRTIPRTQSVRFEFERPEELVLRRVPQAPSNSVESVPDTVRSGNIGRAQPRAKLDHELAENVAPLAERAPAVQLTKIDPAILDRLAENVIDRVEKRIRIERQRRGL